MQRVCIAIWLSDVQGYMAACIINIPEMPRIKANTITIREAIMVECPGETIRARLAS